MVGSDDIAFKISMTDGVPSGNPESFRIKSDFPQRYTIDYVNDTLFFLRWQK